MPNTNRIVLILLIIFAQTQLVSAQNKRTVNGNVTDAKTGETLIGASVKLKGSVSSGTETNAYGFFSVNTPEGSYEISVSFIGYKTVKQTLKVFKDLVINFALEEDNQLNEVVISAVKRNENVSSPQMGLQKK